MFCKGVQGIKAYNIKGLCFFPSSSLMYVEQSLFMEKGSLLEAVRMIGLLSPAWPGWPVEILASTLT